MRLFRLFVEMLGRDAERNYLLNDLGGDKSKLKESVKRELLSVITQSKIVVNDALDGGADLRADEVDRDVSPPFKTTWLQMPDNTSIRVGKADGTEELIHGVFLHELEPYFYLFAIVADDPIEPGSALKLSTGYINTTKNDHKDHYVWDVMSTFLRPFAKAHALGVVKANEHVKFKIDGEKILHKIKTVVYVVPKTARAKSEAEKKYRIDWTHRWAVRGHWRAITGVGKDRSGSYSVKGFTWVEDHIKGPDHKLFIEKTRVVDQRFYKKQEYLNDPSNFNHSDGPAHRRQD